MGINMEKGIWQEQAEAHPALQPQDAVKLCYQAAFGAEHLLTAVEEAGKWFQREWAAVPVTEEPLFELLNEGVCRMNLGAWKREGLPGEWLWKLFVHSRYQQGDAGIFTKYLEQVKDLASHGNLPFTQEEYNSYLESYLQKGLHPVHHSNRYREQEHPSYRLVSCGQLQLLPVLRGIWKKTSWCEHPVIAIDGRCASGKSTLAARLAQITGASVVHMDDFFLPQELRVPSRLAQPGGNIHYERFRAEVLPYLGKRQDFAYARFDCGRMQLGEKRTVAGGKGQIVEGTYSCHPALGEYMDIRVFTDVEEQEQLRRIEQRNGIEAAEVFRTRWIPMEESYFDACGIREAADIYGTFP